MEEPVAAEIKHTLLTFNRRFKELVEQYQTFKQVEVVGKARKEYGEGLNRLSMWLKDAEELLVKEVPCKHSELKEYLNKLDVSWSLFDCLCFIFVFSNMSFSKSVFKSFFPSDFVEKSQVVSRLNLFSLGLTR